VVRARIVADIVSAYERADEANGTRHGGVARADRGGGNRPARPRRERGEPSSGG
jgi:hypothetical protein